MKAKTLISIAGATLLALALSGCIPTSFLTKAPDKSAPDTTEETSTPEPSFAPDTPEQPEPVGNLTFGGIITWEDGVSLSVSDPTEYTPGEYAIGMEQPASILINLTLTNGSNANLEPAVYGTMSSGGIESISIWDSEGGVGSSPATVILPGGTVTWTEAWSITDPANIIYEVSAGYEYVDVIFVRQG